MTARLAVYLRDDGTEDRKLEVNLGTCAEAFCKFGDKTYRVRVFDETNNLRFDETTNSQTRQDWVYVYKDKGMVVSDYGRPLSIDGELFDIKVSDDGSGMAATKYVGKTGLIRINHQFWEGEIVGNNYKCRLMAVSDAESLVRLPVGDYKFSKWEEYSAPKKPRYLLRVDDVPITVKPDETTDVVIGLPLKATLKATVQGARSNWNWSLRTLPGGPQKSSGQVTYRRRVFGLQIRRTSR